MNHVMTCQANAASTSVLPWQRSDATPAIFLLHCLLTDLNFGLKADGGAGFSFSLYITQHVFGKPTAG